MASLADYSGASGAPKGCVIWVTGLSGSGKTTISQALQRRFADGGRKAILLDGDGLREVLGRTDDFQTSSRLELAHTYARLAKYLADQGQIVICATISMFHQVRAWNRQHNPNYFEVYLRVPHEVLLARDPKGLYKSAKAERDEGGMMVGRDAAFEEPISQDLTLDNHGDISTESAIERIWNLLKSKPWFK